MFSVRHALILIQTVEKSAVEQTVNITDNSNLTITFLLTCEIRDETHSWPIVIDQPGIVDALHPAICSFTLQFSDGVIHQFFKSC